MPLNAKKKGAALIAALMLLLVAGVFVSVSAALATSNASQSLTLELGDRAHYLAMSGCELVWARLSRDAELRLAVAAGPRELYGDTGGGLYAYEQPGRQFKVLAEMAAGGEVTLRATGYYEQSSAEVAARFTMDESGVGDIVWSAR